MMRLGSELNGEKTPGGSREYLKNKAKKTGIQASEGKPGYSAAIGGRLG
jgi:hypothetical protein